MLYADSWGKMARAKYHRDVLEERIAKHFRVKANRPTLGAKRDVGPNKYQFFISHVPYNLDDFLVEVSHGVGDAIQNIRAALDYLAYGIAVRKKVARQDRERVQFPIHTVKGKLIQPGFRTWRYREARYERFFGKTNMTIMERYQPYRGRAGRPDRWIGRYRHPLTVLRDISNRDKHRLPSVIAAIPNSLRFSPPPGVSFGIMVGDVFGPNHPPLVGDAATVFGRVGLLSQLRVELGTKIDVLQLIGSNLPDEMDVAGDITPQITLPKHGSVIFEIDRIWNYVVQILDEFEPRL